MRSYTTPRVPWSTLSPLSARRTARRVYSAITQARAPRELREELLIDVAAWLEVQFDGGSTSQAYRHD